MGWYWGLGVVVTLLFWLSQGVLAFGPKRPYHLALCVLLWPFLSFGVVVAAIVIGCEWFTWLWKTAVCEWFAWFWKTEVPSPEEIAIGYRKRKERQGRPNEVTPSSWR